MAKIKITTDEIKAVLQGKNDKVKPGIPKGELKRLRDAKREEVETASDMLFSVIWAVTLCEGKGLTGDFHSICRQIIQEIVPKLRKKLDGQVLPSLDVSNIKKFGIEDAARILARMVSLNYNPDDQVSGHDVLPELWALYFYYNSVIDKPPTLIEMRLDLARSRLLAYVAGGTAYVDLTAAREVIRTSKSSKTIRSKISDRQQKTLSIYSRKQIENAMWKRRNPSEQARLVIKEFEKMGDKAPGHSTVRRYLEKFKKEELI